MIINNTPDFMQSIPNPIPDKEDKPGDKASGQSETQNKIDQINETGAIITGSGKHVIHCLTIIGQVEGHYILPSQNKTTKYEHVIPQLVSIEEDPNIDGLLILLNTVGGDVEAGLAIAELVAGMKKPTVSLVLGGGHSIGVPLAVAAKRSFIVPSASMTIHPVRMNGLMLGVPQAFEYFQRMQKRITRFVINHSNITEERFTQLSLNTTELIMDVGTILDGVDAVKEGLIDSLGTLSDAIDYLYEMINQEKEKDKENEDEQDQKEEKITKTSSKSTGKGTNKITKKTNKTVKKTNSNII